MYSEFQFPVKPDTQLACGFLELRGFNLHCALRCLDRTGGIVLLPTSGKVLEFCFGQVKGETLSLAPFHQISSAYPKRPVTDLVVLDSRDDAGS
ncbi:uncharacterized protein ACHE_60864A [Aspergillus chevalieri]|uniref:Uncharacterized protein n=1 Tax=Aspergillus chevalieri TaxID=182096 RepID=A0A7R7ZQR0_ASPCH|nr:uncharacterized protein ACHE_60864A [Aspergillus chevalieri]BCR90978.1 hypothetical protein ACHE_60864A [Aspergillus chevalieri]